MLRATRSTCLMIAAILSFGGAEAKRASGPPGVSPLITIEHVTVVPMTEGGSVLTDATVVVRDGRIVSLNGPAPRGARKIDGRGKWLIPGMMDMHVHLPSDDYYPFYQGDVSKPPMVDFDTQDTMTPYVANGVTQIMNMDARAANIGQRNAVEQGKIIGPHMALAALIDGRRQGGRVAITPLDGRQAVRDAKAEGYGFIKLYWRLDIDTFTAINDEARIQGMKVLGHIPRAFEGRLDRAFVPGFTMVAHAEEYSKHSEDFSDADANRFAQLAKKNGTALTGTLTTMRWISSQARSLDELKALSTLKYVHPVVLFTWIEGNSYNKNSSPERVAYFERMVDFHRRLVRAFKAAGVPVVAGTDALNPGCVPGFSMHEELGELVKAGLTNEEALGAATRVPAAWLGVLGDRGTIEVGKRADLVLLDGDPLGDIANTRKIAGVMLSGRWLDRETLDGMLADVARHNEANRKIVESYPPSVLEQ